MQPHPEGTHDMVSLAVMSLFHGCSNLLYDHDQFPSYFIKWNPYSIPLGVISTFRTSYCVAQCPRGQ